MKMPLFIAAGVLAFCISGCNAGSGTENAPTVKKAESSQVAEAPAQQSLFTLLPPEKTGVAFENNLGNNVKINPYRYVNAFNGGGVAIGDINNDGFADIYFTANIQPNTLYLSQGGLTYKDVTAEAGVDGGRGWSSGVTMADVNGDGLLDIYVCKQYISEKEEERENMLYINNGDGTFTDKAKEYGVANSSLSVQATFFDYDLDGDLDMYLGNHPWKYTLDYDYNLAQQRNPELSDSDCLYRNEGGKSFTDVTVEAGIKNFGFTLGLVSGDFNKDGLPDVYVANDHAGPDRYWQNNGNGTFTNIVNEAMGHTANFAMGLDAADINNDGWLDFVNVDMLAEDNFRQKTLMSGMNTEAFWRSVESGYHFQYMRNMLQINNGNGTFSEVGQLAGITKTDWSWTALFADFSNNGRKDLYITNGYRVDARDNDFLIARKAEIKRRLDNNLPPLKQGEWGDQMFEKLAATKLPNHYFENNGDYTFTSRTDAYGLGHPGFSHGASYADLDNDGDLDLVVNNMNEPAHIYQNNATAMGQRSTRVKLKGDAPNHFGVGGKITATINGEEQYYEITHTRGFQSAVEPVAHFGMGEHDKIESLRVVWPDGREQVVKDVPVGTVVTFEQSKATPGIERNAQEDEPLFADVTKDVGVSFRHTENKYNDFDKEVLLPHKMSQFGPGLAVGDANGDGYDDFYVGGAAGQAGALYLANGNGYREASAAVWKADRNSEDIGAAFFDADGDGDQDLYITSGGNEFPIGSARYQDRLYLNDGAGGFAKSSDALPDLTASGSCVVPGDFDGDSDLDLFVGGRVLPGTYPYPAKSYLLRNDGAGGFEDVTAELAPDLVEPGLVTTAVWMDYDNNQSLDLVVGGEWMPLSFFTQKDGKFTNETKAMGYAETTGWWNRIRAADFDNDGDLDLIAGNLGLNYKYKASGNEPFQVWGHDFDKSGTKDIVLGYYNKGTCYPVRGRQCSSDQIPSIKKKFPTYRAFASANVEEVYGPDLNEALHYSVSSFASVYLENRGNGSFNVSKLPNEAQFSLINGIVPMDYNGDGNMDVVVAGNLFVSEVETGRADAGNGLVMVGDGKGGFEPVTHFESGFFANGDVKDLRLITGGNGNARILVANNDGKLQLFEFSGNAAKMKLAIR